MGTYGLHSRCFKKLIFSCFFKTLRNKFIILFSYITSIRLSIERYPKYWRKILQQSGDNFFTNLDSYITHENYAVVVISYFTRGLTTFMSFHAPHVPLTDLIFFTENFQRKKKTSQLSGLEPMLIPSMCQCNYH